MTLHSIAICAPGRIRTENQDNVYINGAFREDIADNSVFRRGDNAPDRGLYAVADGMGGEKHGELAALIAVKELRSADVSDGCSGLAGYLANRNADICDLMQKNDGARSGSTFAGLSVNGENADIANIGDSRVYLLRGGALSQISEDHTSVRQMVELGAITKEAARSHPDRHKLTQHLGIHPHEMVIEPHTVSMQLKDGDLFLLCSDGLTEMLDDQAIEAILSGAGKLEGRAEALYDTAMQNGGKDNISILLVQAETEKPAPQGAERGTAAPTQRPDRKTERRTDNEALSLSALPGAERDAAAPTQRPDRKTELRTDYATLRLSAFTAKRRTFPYAKVILICVAAALIVLLLFSQRLFTRI